MFPDITIIQETDCLKSQVWYFNQISWHKKGVLWV